MTSYKSDTWFKQLTDIMSAHNEDVVECNNYHRFTKTKIDNKYTC